jgi:hypothetical protein
MGWARADEMGRNGAHAQSQAPNCLKKTRSPQTRNRIGYRLPLEYPASHREAQSRIAQVHELHKYPQPSESASSPQGRISNHYRQNSSGMTPEQGPTVPLQWHESNRPGMLGAGSCRCQCASVFSGSPVRPAGGTTTVERLLSAVSFRKSDSAWRCKSSQRRSNSALCRLSFSN